MRSKKILRLFCSTDNTKHYNTTHASPTHSTLVVVLLDLIGLQERQESLSTTGNGRGTCGGDVGGSFGGLGCVEGGEFGGEVGGEGRDLGCRGGGVGLYGADVGIFGLCEYIRMSYHELGCGERSGLWTRVCSCIRRVVGSEKGTYGRGSFVALELFNVKVLDEVYKDPNEKSEDRP